MHTGVLADSERSVSPVIAVVLTAALAIVLSVTIGAFVLSSGDDGTTQEPAPTISAEIDRGPGTVSSDNTKITISHKGGDTVDVSNLRIITEAQCFDNDLLKLSQKRTELVNLPASVSGGNIKEKNIAGDSIIQENSGTEPLVGDSPEWQAGGRLTFEINSNDNDGAECNIPERALMRVDVIHEPSNSIIVQESFGKSGFTPAALKDEVSPPTKGATSSHTLVLKNINYGTSGNSGDEVDEIIVDYNPDNSGPAVDFNSIDNSKVDVTMTRTLSPSGGGINRSSITLYGSTYTGSEATFNTFVFSQTDVAGPISIEMNDIKNPTSAGTYDVEITLTGDAGQKTFTKTINIEN